MKKQLLDILDREHDLAVAELHRTGRPVYRPPAAEAVAALKAEHDVLHGGVYAVAVAADDQLRKGLITREKRDTLVREARLQRRLRKARRRATEAD